MVKMFICDIKVIGSSPVFYQPKMAQKINTNNYRLNKRLNWNALFCTHSFTDYFSTLLNVLSIYNISQNTVKNLKMLQTNLTVTKASKRYKLNTKMLKQHLYYHIIKNFTPLKTKYTKVITFTNNHIVSLCKNFKISFLNQLYT